MLFQHPAYFVEVTIKIKFVAGDIEDQKFLLVIPEKDFLARTKKESMKRVRAKLDALLFDVTKHSQINLKAFRITSLKQMYFAGHNKGYLI